MWRTATLLCLTALAACSLDNGSFRYVSDVERTWIRGVVTLPAGVTGVEAVRGRVVTTITKVNNSNNTFPLVLYLHGCTGIGNFSFFDRLASRGYVVIAPDSFARRLRPRQCDPAKTRGGNNLFVYDFRSAEITYALERIESISWIDFDNLFLIGVSEGAVAAALFRGDVFNARVLAQWTCTGAPLIEGIDAPAHEAILSIVRENDPYYSSDNTIAQSGDCGTFLAGRQNSESVILPSLTDSRDHDVFANEAGVDMILEFLFKHRR